jgi:uridylate kinase
LAAKHGVDGVFSADPKKDKSAKRFKTLGYDDFILEKLHIMDHSALLLARDYGMPVHIFNFDAPGAMKAICSGSEDVGTYIAPKTTLATY